MSIFEIGRVRKYDLVIPNLLPPKFANIREKMKHDELNVGYNKNVT